MNLNRGQGCGWSSDRGRGRKNYYFCGGGSNNSNFKSTTRNDNHKAKVSQNKNSKNDEKNDRPMWNNWTLVMCLPYIETLSWSISSLPKEEKRKNVEPNWTNQYNDIDDPSNLTNLDVTDFFETFEETIMMRKIIENSHGHPLKN